VQQLVQQNKDAVAAIIIEPVAGNMGCILPKEGFLEGLRKLCDKENIVLIFDEVMTGFRLAQGGAQQKLNVKADLVTYGKVIGAGMPVGAFGGEKEIMQHIAPLGNVYQAGTLSGNPVAMIAGYTLLKFLKENPTVYEELDNRTKRLHQGLAAALGKGKHPFIINSIGSMISVHFGDHPVESFADAASADNHYFNNLFHYMLDNGVYLPPSAFETWFVSHALSDADIDYTVQLAERFSRQ
jgi:glutamate-1-semialdehyde 2,1-aminomutase